MEFDQDCEGHIDDELLIDPRSYQKLVGKLMYLTITRPDISFTIQNLSQFMRNPKKSHMEATFESNKILEECSRTWDFIVIRKLNTTFSVL